MMMTGKEKKEIETSVAKAPGQRLEAQRAKMLAFEYESSTLGTPGT